MEKFLPREFPKKDFNKKILSNDKSQGRKTVFAVLLATVLGSSGLWFLGNQPNDSMNISETTPIVSIMPSLSPTSTPKIQDIVSQINNLTKDLKGSYGFYVYNLITKKAYGSKESQIFSAASMMKLPVILTLYFEAEAGRLNLETKYTLAAVDKRGGAGSMYYKPAGTVYTYQKMIELMGQQSDNTAFYVFRTLLGDQKIQKNINDLGMKNTSIEQFDTSPFDMCLLIRKLYSGSIVSRVHRDQILGYLTNTFDESRIPVGVPTGVRVVHKVGTDIGVISDGGIVIGPKPYVVVIMSKDVLESQAKEVLPKISKAIWEFENK